MLGKWRHTLSLIRVHIRTISQLFICHKKYWLQNWFFFFNNQKYGLQVPFNRRVWPICLPYDSKVLISEENIGRSGFISGWGRQEFNGRTSDVLREADVEIKSNEECNKAFERVVQITDHYLCAGSMGSTKDSCQGDSGGPLMQIDPQKRRFYLTGVVSFGRRCATPGFPGVYARVSYFLDWISKNLWFINIFNRRRDKILIYIKFTK